MKTQEITIKVDPSTLRWLKAFAKAQSGSTIPPGKVTPEQILEQAAFCIGDYAGRRPGSWEAAVAGSMMMSSGYQKQTRPADWGKCDDADQEENQQARARAAKLFPVSSVV